MTNSIGEIADAEFLFVIGSNTTEAHPVIAMEMKAAALRGATLVVADPRSIWLTQVADRHLKLRPGTDVWLLNAMAHVIIAEDLCDWEFIEQNTEHFDLVREAVADYTPERAEEITGVAAEDIRATARQYATAERAGIYYTLGITEHSHGTDNVYALSNLVLMTGNLGKRSCGMNPLRGQNNVQGANDAGATPIFLPGYQRVTDDAVREKFNAAWNCTIPPEPGWNLNEMMHHLGKEIRGVFLMGEDIVMSEANVSRLEAGLNDLEFLMMIDIFPNETTRFADVVLPAGCFVEKDGVFTNSERRIQRVRRAVAPPGTARPDWEILLALAQGCGAKWNLASPADIYAEMASLAPSFAGISHARIDERGVGLQWPCTDDSHPGTPYLHKGGVLRGKGQFEAVAYRPSAEAADPEYPLVLSTGRTLYQYNSATQTRRSPGAAARQPDAFVQIHPRDARQRGIENDAMVEIFSRRGAIQGRAEVTRDVRPGCIWMPFHFAEARANLLTNDAGDPVTGTAEYKVCAAEVRAL